MIKGELVKSFIARHIKVAVIVAAAGGLLSFFLIMLFPGMDHLDAETVSSSWPQIMKDLFGDPLYAFTDIYGWMQLQLFHIFLWVYFGIFASLLASDIVGKEIEEKSMDILLSVPVTRAELIASRLLGSAMVLAISLAPLAVACLTGVNALGYTLMPGALFASIVLLLLLSFVFAAVTLVISVFVHKQAYSVLITLGLFGFMFLYEEMLSKMVPFLNGFTFIFPLHYYKPESMLVHHVFSVFDPIMLAAFFLVFSVI